MNSKSRKARKKQEAHCVAHIAGNGLGWKAGKWRGRFEKQTVKYLKKSGVIIMARVRARKMREMREMKTTLVLKNGFTFRGTIISETDAKLFIDEIKLGITEIDKTSIAARADKEEGE